VLLVAVALVILFFIVTPKSASQVQEEVKKEQLIELNTRVREFLESKDSPLAPDTEFLMTLPHWKLLIAVSAIESQYCKRQLAYNCWGIGGDSAYRHYSSFREAAQDANDLITRWQAKGRWLTVEDMNCHYVQPCNPNWVKVVNINLDTLNRLANEIETGQ
jgi:hypothetical protein